MTKSHNQKQHEKEKVYFSLQFSGHNPPLSIVKPETGDASLEARTEAATMDECCLLTYSAWIAQFSFLAQDHPARSSISHNEVKPSPLHTHQPLIKKMLHRLAYTCWRHLLSLRSLFLVSMKLTNYVASQPHFFRRPTPLSK